MSAQPRLSDSATAPASAPRTIASAGSAACAAMYASAYDRAAARSAGGVDAHSRTPASRSAHAAWKRASTDGERSKIWRHAAPGLALRRNCSSVCSARCCVAGC